MFRGRFEHTIDNKGRISLPAKFREVLSSEGDYRLVITNSFENCLIAYPFAAWQKIEAQLKSHSFTQKKVRDFVRFFVSGSSECSIDKLGRIMIPSNLRDFASLEKDITFAGVLDKFEIWNKEKWENVVEGPQENFDEITTSFPEIKI